MISGSNWMKGLKGRLLVLVGIPVLAILILAGVSVQGIGFLNDQVSLFAEKRVPITGNLWELRSATNAMLKHAWGAYGLVGNPSEVAKEFKYLNDRRASFDSALLELKQADLLAKAKELLVKVENEKIKLDDELGALEKAINSGQDSASVKEILVTRIDPVGDSVIANMRELTKLGEERNDQLKAEALQSGKNTETTIFATLILGLLVTVVFGFLLAKMLSEKLSSITEEINQSSDRVNEGSMQLSSASQQLSGAASEAASSLQETVSAIQELSSMVKMNANNSREAAALSNQSKSSAEQGEKEMSRLIESMTEISQSSKKIEEIINVIDDIAFQTNLLALNAAVEAARAGEQGKGFAVVADAVRNLAHRSSVAAKDIANLIKEGVQKSDNGTKIAERSSGVLKEIVTSVKKVSELITEISTASQEQSTGIEQIGKAMDQLDQSTQGNASAAEQVAASSEEMSSQSSQLKMLVGNLEEVVSGQNKGSREPFADRAIPRASKNKKIIPMLKAKANKPESVIPFESDQPKVGNTDGF